MTIYCHDCDWPVVGVALEQGRRTGKYRCGGSHCHKATERMTATSDETELNQLNADVNLYMVRMMKAAQTFRSARSPESFEALRTATAEYVSVHRRWFALVCPDESYDALYGSP